MTTPDQPASLADVIDLREWLDRRGVPTADAAVAALHDLIARTAALPHVHEAARLGRHAEHLQLFSQRLAAALAQREDLHRLEFVDRYTNDPAFRDELNAAAGIAAYTAIRTDHTLPAPERRAQAVIDPKRQRQLVKAIEDHAPRYHQARLAPARYIAEAHVPGGTTSTEWEWIAYYIAAHPHVLDGPVLHQKDIDHRDNARADQLSEQAYHAFTAGDHQHALALIDEAELHQPRPEWRLIRDTIRREQHRRDLGTRPGGAVPPPSRSAPPTPPAVPPAPEHRGAHR